MSIRELRDLGVEALIQSKNQNSSVLDDVDANQMRTIAVATMATPVNPLYDAIDFSSAEGKKLYQKATQSFPDYLKYNSDPKDMIKFVECIQSKS